MSAVPPTVRDTMLAAMPNGRSTVDRDRRLRFDRLCGKFRADLLRFAIWLTGNRAIAEDVVQNTLLRAWNRFDSLRDPIAAHSWLLTIARREAIRTARDARPPTTSLESLSDEDQVAIAYRSTPETRDLHRVMRELPALYREPLLRQVLFGYSTREIAEQMNLSLSAVLVRLHRARLAVGRQLGGRRSETPRDIRGFSTSEDQTHHGQERSTRIAGAAQTAISR